MGWQKGLGAIALVGGALALGAANVGAMPLTAGAKDIASGVESGTPATQVATRRAAPSAPRIGAPRIAARPVIRPPHVVRPPRVVRRRPGVIIGISPGFYYEPYPYYYEPYYLEAPDDSDEIANCIRRFKSYDVRTRTYLGYDGLRHPCP
jgi:BA14K-like protein